MEQFYVNPFADEENDPCYAEIEIDVDQGEYITPEKPATVSLAPRASSVTAAAVPTHYQQPTYNSTVQTAEGFSTRDRGLSNSTIQRQAFAETPISAVHDSSRVRREEESLRAENESAMQETYDNVVHSLREQLSKVTEESKGLYVANTKLETRVRGLILEKEHLERTVQQEQQRSSMMEEKIAQLEAELNDTLRRTDEMVKSMQARQAAAVAQPVLTAASSATHPPPTALKRQHQQDEEALRVPPQHQQMQPHLPGIRRYSASGIVEHSAEQSASSSMHAVSARPYYTDPACDHVGLSMQSFEQKRPPPPFPLSNMNSTGGGGSRPGRSAAKSAMMTEKEKEADYQQHMVNIADLEAELQLHSQARDALTTTLQRLESARVRTMADRAKKTATEKDLEAEERIIGRIRLQLRNHANSQ